MRKMMVLAFLIGGCDTSDYSITAEDTLALRAIDGEEEDLVRSVDGDTTLERGEAPLPLFRECDAQGTFVGLMDKADENADGDLGERECAKVKDREGPPPHHWHMLRIVYDADDSGDLSEAERADMLDDFSDRCEALHERLLTDFDANGDGILDEAEQQAAHEAMRAHHEQMQADGHRPPPPPGGERGELGDRPPRPEPGEFPPPMVDEFDADGDGELSSDEVQTLRDTLRDRIRSGAPMGPPPPPK